MIQINNEFNQLQYLTNIEIPTLHLTFNIPLRPNQINQWRGAIIQSTGGDKAAFHNHQEGEKKYHYNYPLIQYRTHRGKAAIFGIGKGSQLLRNWILAAPPAIEIGKKLRPLRLLNIQDDLQQISMSEQTYTYYMHQYLPFNRDNFNRWKNKSSLKEGIDILESVLVGQLINFASGMDWQLPEHLQVTIEDIHFMDTLKHYQVKRVAFNLTFTANIQLPVGMGLGKGVSHGFGVTRRFN